MDDFLEKKPKKHSDAALATAARFSWEGFTVTFIPGLPFSLKSKYCTTHVLNLKCVLHAVQSDA